MKETADSETKKMKPSRWRKIFRYGILFLILFPILIYFLVQVSWIQNVLVDYATNKINDSIEGEVTIERVDLSFSDGLELEGFLLKGIEGDTILQSKSLNIDLASSLYSIFNNSIAIERISLVDPTMNIIKERGQTKNNIELILATLIQPTERGDSGKPFVISLSEINVKNLALLIRDENKNEEQSFQIRNGNIKINTFLKDDLLDIAHIILDQPVVRITKLGVAHPLQAISINKEEFTDSLRLDTNSTHIRLGSLEVIKGLISYNDNTKIPSEEEDVLDPSHFEISKINLLLSDFDLHGTNDVCLDLDRFDFIDNKGFQVNSLTCEGIEINSKTVSLQDFKFITERTNLNSSLSLEFKNFSDFEKFEQNVKMNAKFESSTIHFGDIMHFVKRLNTSSFFLKNKKRSLVISGEISGPIDNLIGRNMSIKVGNEMQLEANFSTRNITKKGGEFFHFGMKSLETNMTFLKSFIPGFRPPENFDKLGRIKFKGNFDGYLKDFVAFGTLKSAVGDAFLDMRLDIKDGSSLAKYSGELSVDHFQLGKWTDNLDFGLVDFSASITDGKGLTLNSVYSDLYATVESLTFKGYEYRDFVMDAQVDKNNFNGEFSISDENIDFVFDGNIEIRDNVPHLDFKANIENIDLFTLNLVKQPFSIHGNVDINGYGVSLNDVVGNMIASDLVIRTNDTIYAMDTISLTAYETANENRRIKLFSDIASIELEGKYELQDVLPATKAILKKNYPHFTQNWKEVNTNVNYFQDLRFDISIFDSRNFLELAGIKDVTTKNFKAKGSIDTRKGDLSFASSIPFLQFHENSFWHSQILISSDNKSGDILINVDSTVIGSNSFNPIDIQSKMNGDTVNFLVSTKDIIDSLESIDIQGRLIPHPKGYELNITDNKIEALGSVWSFDKNNRIILGNNYHDVENLRMTDGYRSIAIDDVNNKGIAVYLADFNFLTLNGLINYDKMDFSGQGDFSLLVNDVYNKVDLEASMYVHDFKINNDSYGTLEVDVSKEADQPIALLMSLGNENHHILVNGSLDPSKDNYLNADIEGKKFPLKVFQYLLKDGIKNTFGGADLKVNVNGPIADLKIDGKGSLDGGVTIVYTGVEYIFDKEAVRLTEKVIDLTGAKIIDPHGGIGMITGGLNHNVFRDFTLNATISGKDVVALNTTKFDNPLYYGFGKGDMTARFTGPFHLVNMKIDAVAKEESVLNIPIWEGESSTDKNFIQFITREEMLNGQITKNTDFRFEGLDIDIDLTMTPAAQVNIIFDESRGDIIQGNGRGNLKMNITRYGDFDIYGTFDIETGEYLFTALGAVAKPFQVRRGGQIRWTGDPINATLNITADYQVRTSMEVFLSEVVRDNPQLKAASGSKTQVELILNLGGTLYNPMVNFGLNFPDLDGELRTVAQSKMRTLNANQAELNSQVLGLIVFNSFLPSSSSEFSLAGSDFSSAGIGTLSEFVSSQLSLLFTGLLNEALADNGLISGIDFDIGLRKNSFNGVQSTNSDVLPDEIEVHLKNRFKFLDERLSLDLSGNYVREDVLIGGDYFIGDFVLEYFLTDDRKLKLRMYGRYDYDEIIGQRRQKYGLGLGYRTEFGTLSDFKQVMAKEFRDGVGDSIESQD